MPSVAIDVAGKTVVDPDPEAPRALPCLGIAHREGHYVPGLRNSMPPLSLVRALSPGLAVIAYENDKGPAGAWVRTIDSFTPVDAEAVTHLVRILDVGLVSVSVQGPDLTVRC